MTDKTTYKIDFEKLSVDNNEDCTHWISLLDTAVQYHRDMSEMFKEMEPDEELRQIHEAWANGIADAAALIEMWNNEDKKSKEFVVGVD